MQTTVSDPNVATDQPTHVRWGAIFAGAVVIVVALVMISELFAAIGLFTFDPVVDKPNASTFAMATGIGWALAGIIATFLGAWVTGLLLRPTRASTGALHGIVAWSVSILVVGALMTTAIGKIAGGAFNVIGKTAQGAGQAAPQVAQMMGVGDGMQDVAGEIQRNGGNLAQMLPALQPVLSGQASPEQRDQVVGMVAQTTGVSREQAQQTLDRWQGMYASATSPEAQAKARQAAQVATENAAMIALWAFIAMALGAACGAAGGAIGARQHYAPLIHRDQRGTDIRVGSPRPSGPTI